MNSNFIDIKLKNSNIDIFIVRSAILKSIKHFRLIFKGRLLDVGCGKMPYKEYLFERTGINKYVGLDIDTALIYDQDVKPDFTWDGYIMPFNDDEFDTAIATEVLEHVFDIKIILSETYRVLKPGGYFFFTVPFLWNLHEVPNDYYRYTPYSLERYLKDAGFKDMRMNAMGGWHASMAQMIGLWVRRAPIRNWQRNFLSILAIPVIKYLIKKDKQIPFKFKEREMITGLYGIAIK